MKIKFWKLFGLILFLQTVSIIIFHQAVPIKPPYQIIIYAVLVGSFMATVAFKLTESAIEG